MFEERFKVRLASQKRAGLYRNPPEITKRQGKYIFLGNQKVLNFASNDYLGLGTSSVLQNKVAKNFKTYGTSSSSSRLVSGNFSAICRAEGEYAKYFGYEDALFFPSGYQANIGILTAFFDKGDTIIFDKHIHASSVKGMALSGARFMGYNHNSMKHLIKRLDAHRETETAVITESLFSMDGDFLDMEGFLKVKRQYGFLSIVDEAHALGALGEGGRGLGRSVADITVGTFGKALGLFGAFVLLPNKFKEYLFNFSSPLIYTTTLPEAHAVSAVDILEIIYKGDGLRAQLRDVSLLMRDGLKRAGLSVNGDAHIISVEIGNESRAVAVAGRLLDKGIFVLPARFPTVPVNKAILRVSMTALHTEEDVALFIDTLKEVISAVE
ncbi:Aminotransferase, class I and II [uncultured Desulfobacterium sp.]|uniref:8-amino-7-oxononanoate synthase n=1 Tax=uncultured Desulfobacterium sp. TaxID=201089 RepID=A0A445MU66_9BACT|nr:Aminotransferase, class I and II [uncultured Desulfobacterium sp.]